MAAEEERTATSRAFSAYGRTLDLVLYFKYLGRVLSSADDDWTDVIGNLMKARAVWRRMTRILSREGEMPRVFGFLFKSVVQSVLIFGEETWVVTPCMVRVLGCLQDQVAATDRVDNVAEARREVGVNLGEGGKSRSGV